MNWSALQESFQQVWQNKPGLIVLLGVGFVVFVLIVVDVRLHKKRKRKERPYGRKHF